MCCFFKMQTILDLIKTLWHPQSNIQCWIFFKSNWWVTLVSVSNVIHAAISRLIQLCYYCEFPTTAVILTKGKNGKNQQSFHDPCQDKVVWHSTALNLPCAWSSDAALLQGGVRVCIPSWLRSRGVQWRPVGQLAVSVRMWTRPCWSRPHRASLQADSCTISTSAGSWTVRGRICRSWSQMQNKSFLLWPSQRKLPIEIRYTVQCAIRLPIYKITNWKNNSVMLWGHLV